jgi:hypothetical protein
MPTVFADPVWHLDLPQYGVASTRRVPRDASDRRSFTIRGKRATAYSQEELLWSRSLVGLGEWS